MEYQNIQQYKDEMKRLLRLEMGAQQEQIRQSFESIGKMKKLGFGIFPLQITNRSFGVGEYPEIVFKIPFNQSIDRFKSQNPVELFSESGEIQKGVLVYIHINEGKVRLYGDDFPDWLDLEHVGLRISLDEKSYVIAQKAIENLDERNVFANFLFENKPISRNDSNFVFSESEHLNASQNKAVHQALSDARICILHGPPGTGKTTTLTEAISQLVQQKKKVLAVAPSNMAVDHLALSLIEKDVQVLRIGNPIKISEELARHTVEGKLAEGKVFQELKKLKIQAEEYRRMASQYKRNFGKEEREQRRLIWSHYRQLKKEIGDTIDAYKEKWKSETQVICGTPVGLAEELKRLEDFEVVVIDEAGQCLQPFAWIVMTMQIKKVILAGDPFQLPPTVISTEAEKGGLNVSILELFMRKSEANLLNTQYRMEAKIAEFSNQYFYKGQLKTPDTLRNESTSVLFYDTVGTDSEEIKEADGASIYNLGEVNYIPQIIQNLGLQNQNIAVISPYSGQVAKLKESSLQVARISTIDSFQGQEFETIIISLVRSNDKQEIGFLKDYRRMNVALTRAKNQLIVLGDSATIGNDPFFKAFLDYVEQINAYHTVWELM